MKARYGSLALALLCVTGNAWADDDDDVEQREDPWAYDQAKAEKRERAEQEERDSERSFGSAGEFALVAERLVGISKTGRRIKQTGTDPTESVTRVHLLLNQNGDVVGYSAPRVAFDLFVMDGLSLGGALGYSSDADEADPEDAGTGWHRQFLLSPRLGYAYMFSDLLGVWPRAGITYQDIRTGSAKVALLAASVDANLVLVPTANAVVTLGPTLDLGLIGKINPDGLPKKTDIAVDEFGFSVGFGLFF